MTSCKISQRRSVSRDSDQFSQEMATYGNNYQDFSVTPSTFPVVITFRDRFMTVLREYND